MRHRSSFAALAVLCACLLLPQSGLHARPAGADDISPTAIPPTVQPTVVVEPTVTATLVPLVIHRETGSPVALVTAVPTSAPTARAIRATPAATASFYSSPPDVGSYSPSPDELRIDAQLRWGKRVPSAVRRWAFLIVPAARRYNVEPNLVAAVITMESGGDPSAWNASSDARGLMQVLHGSFDPAQNIDSGTRMLAGFLNEFHSLRLALAAYNAGPGAVLQYDGIPPFEETRDYVIIVTYLYDLYGHRSLTASRRAQYSATLDDLRKFAKLRKKVKILSVAGRVHPRPSGACTVATACETSFDESVFPTMDPFWPMPGPADPLQHVGTEVSTN